MLDNRVLHTEEFGYRKKQPEPQLKNIFNDNDYFDI